MSAVQSATQWLASVTPVIDEQRRRELARPLQDRLLDAFHDAGHALCLEWGARHSPQYRAIYWDETEQQYRAYRGVDSWLHEGLEDALCRMLQP